MTAAPSRSIRGAPSPTAAPSRIRHPHRRRYHPQHRQRQGDRRHGHVKVTYPSTVEVSSSTSGTAVPGQEVTFTATVTGNGGTPTGSVQFKNGTQNLGEPQSWTGTARPPMPPAIWSWASTPSPSSISRPVTPPTPEAPAPWSSPWWGMWRVSASKPAHQNGIRNRRHAEPVRAGDHGALCGQHLYAEHRLGRGQRHHL